jgi:hypothetical protein
MRRTALMFALAGMVGALVATPIAVYASHQFTDVSDSAFFSNSVTWMKDNGITVGCNPPSNTKYCPGDNVTRGEMAVFLKRLSENQVVDAATAVNADHADNATNADNAETLDAFSANQLLRVAFGSTDDAPNANGDAVSATITAPQAGWLILSGSIDAFGNGDAYACSLTVDGGLVSGTFRGSLVNSISGHTNNSSENCSTTGVHQVTAGSTVALTIANWNSVSLNDATVWALYVPFDGDGNTP